MPSYYYKKVRRAPVYGKRKRGGGRRKSVSVYKRRQSYRRRGGMRITQRSFRNTFFPDRVFVKFKTYFSWSGTLSVGTSGTTQPIMGNGLYDPTGAFSDNQPMGLDQWAGFYNKYYVTAAKVALTGFVPATGTFVTNYTLIPAATQPTLSHHGPLVTLTRNHMAALNLLPTTDQHPSLFTII